MGITQSVEDTANEVLGKYIVGALSNIGGNYIKNLDVELEFSDEFEIVSSLTAVTSIYDKGNDVVFNQTTFTRHDGNSTLNTGFAYRKLFNDDKAIFGINAFYDREISVTHQRFGLGLEYLTSVVDLRSNYYEAFSDTKLVANDDTEKALDGWDIRADYHLPSFITGNYDITAFTSYYDWSESGGDFTSDGYKIGITAKPYRNLFVEAAIDDDGANNGNFYFLLTYSLKFGDEAALPVKNNSFLELQSVKHRKYDKIIRENKIVKVIKGAVKVSRGN